MLNFKDYRRFLHGSSRKDEKNVDTVRRLLGQSCVTTTSAFSRIEDKDSLEMSREYFF